MAGREATRAWLEIDGQRIAANAKRILSHIHPLRMLAVLKADAYGLGVDRIAPLMKQAGAYGFGVIEIDAALKLKSLGLPIHLMGDFFPQEAEVLAREEIVAPISNLTNARALNQAAERLGKKAHCQFVIDTGMGRLGIQLPEAMSVIEQAVKLSSLNFTGIYSHFPSASDDPEFSRKQVSAFVKLIDACREKGIRFELVHMANSDALHAVPETLCPPFNMVRIGLNLYGFSDAAAPTVFPLEPAVRFRTKVISIRVLPKGSSIGYLRTVILDRDTPVATLPVGYADGIPFALPEGGSVVIKGRRCPVLGRISMDLTTVSVESVPEARPGDEVVCFGEEIPVKEWAAANRSNSYQVMCSIGPRIERILV